MDPLVPSPPLAFAATQIPAANPEPPALSQPSFIDHATQNITLAGSSMGLLGQACALLGQKTIARASIALITHPIFSALMMASGVYLFSQQSVFAVQSYERLLDWEKPTPFYTRLDDLLQVATFGISYLGILLGLSSFAIPLSRYPLQWIRADSWRRQIHDPDIWIEYGRAQKYHEFLKGVGTITNALLVQGSAVLGGAHLLSGYLHKIFNTPGYQNVSYADLLYGAALDIMPYVNVKAYRAARGDRRYGVGPLLNGDPSTVYADYKSSTHYDLPGQAATKAQKMFPALHPEQKASIITNIKKNRRDARFLLDQADNKRPLKQEPQINQRPRQLAPHSFSQDFKALTAPKNPVRRFYNDGRPAPVDLLNKILQHPDAQNSALFPRLRPGSPLHRRLKQLAKASEERLRHGDPRPLEGIPIAVKDAFVGIDGVMNAGSQSLRVSGIEPSPLVQQLVDLGALPIPVGMAPFAMGGNGFSGHGYVRHPSAKSLDPGGSSSATAYVVAHPELPIHVGIGTDTGGSVTKPAAFAGLDSVVCKPGVLLSERTISYHPTLDRIGLMARTPNELREFLYVLTLKEPCQLATRKPVITYLRGLTSSAKPSYQRKFHEQLDDFRQQGYEVRELDWSWDFLVKVPDLLYRNDAYTSALINHANPMVPGWLEPTRRIVEPSIQRRLARGALVAEQDAYWDFIKLSKRYQELVKDKFPSGFVLATPAPETVTTASLTSKTPGELASRVSQLVMAQNRLPDWAKITRPKGHNMDGNEFYGMILAGRQEDVLHFL